MCPEKVRGTFSVQLSATVVVVLLVVLILLVLVVLAVLILLVLIVMVRHDTNSSCV